MHLCDAVHDRVFVVFNFAAAQKLLQAVLAALCCAHPCDVSAPDSHRPLLYAIASTISLFSLQLAEMIGLVRDLYEVGRLRLTSGFCDLLFL